MVISAEPEFLGKLGETMYGSLLAAVKEKKEDFQTVVELCDFYQALKDCNASVKQSESITVGEKAEEIVRTLLYENYMDVIDQAEDLDFICTFLSWFKENKPKKKKDNNAIQDKFAEKKRGKKKELVVAAKEEVVPEEDYLGTEELGLEEDEEPFWQTEEELEI